MKCPKCKSKNLDTRIVTRKPYDIVTCSGSRSVAFKSLRKFICNECSYSWEKS